MLSKKIDLGYFWEILDWAWIFITIPTTKKEEENIWLPPRFPEDAHDPRTTQYLYEMSRW
jgi:hypothetical protein